MTVVSGLFDDAADFLSDAGDVLMSVPVAGAAITGGALSGDVSGGFSAEADMFSKSADLAQGKGDLSAFVPAGGGAPPGVAVPGAPGGEYAWYDPRRYIQPPPRAPTLQQAIYGQGSAVTSMTATSARAVAAQLRAAELTRAGASGGGAFDPGGVGRLLVGVAVVAGGLYLAHRYVLKGSQSR